MAGNPGEDAGLDARIAAARAKHNPKGRGKDDTIKTASLGWRMVTELVVGVLLGGVMGWGLDSLLGTLPLFLIVVGMLGFAAGVRTMMRSAAEFEEKRKASAQPDESP